MTGQQHDHVQPLLDQEQSESGLHASSPRAADDAAEGLPLTDAGEPVVKSTGRTHWILTTCILLGDMLGLGCLSLPSDFARLGWVPALTLLALFAASGLYSGVLYQRLCARVPSATVFDHIGGAAMGGLGRALVYGSIYLAILSEPVIFHLTCVESLRQVFYLHELSYGSASLIVTVIILPLAQVQHIHDVAWVSVFGTLGMLLAVAVVLGKLLLQLWAGQGSSASTEVVARTSPQSALVGVMDIAFAFGGQVNWMRYITTMRDRSRFADAVAITTSIMTAVFVAVGAAGYGLLGSSVDLQKPITSVLDRDGAWHIVMNAGIFVHCIVAYQIVTNVWSASLLHVAAPRLAASLQHSGGGGGAARRAARWRRRLVWLSVTCLCVAFSATASWAMPYFSLVMALIASLGDVMSMFGLPCLFALYLLRMPRWEAALCGALAAAAVALSAAGVVSALLQLVEAISSDSVDGGGVAARAPLLLALGALGGGS